MSKVRMTASVIMGVIIVVAVFFGVYSFAVAKSHETTDNATVEQYMSPVNVRVAGYIKDIRFKEHEHVKKGDTLMIIAKLETDYARFSSLLEKKATTPIVVEQYKTELDMARARVNALERQRSSAHSSVNEVNQKKENAEAAILRAEAALEMAELNLSYTVITAPCDGCLGKRNIEIGQYINPGQSITTIIPDNEKWIIANFKETQVRNLHIGQEVDIEVDAYPDKKFKGKITSISSATGAKYSMIPTDNASGNFVKIRQRVPVRINLNNISSEDNELLVAGMMCIINVKI